MEEKISIKAFKNDVESVWLGTGHWRIVEGKLTLCAGAIFAQEDYDRVFKYFKTKKLMQ